MLVSALYRLSGQPHAPQPSLPQQQLLQVLVPGVVVHKRQPESGRTMLLSSSAQIFGQRKEECELVRSLLQGNVARSRTVCILKQLVCALLFAVCLLG